MQYMPFAQIQNLAPIVKRFGYGLEDDYMEGPSSVIRMKGGKLIPPESFYREY